MIPQSFIRDLLDRIDIVNVIEQHVQLKKAGANMLGLCPFHTEKTPSFTVSPSKQFYHCFGCGKNGSAITFLMEHTGFSFVEAVHELANATGMIVPDDSENLSKKHRDEEKAASLTRIDVMTKANLFYRQQLRQAEQAISYLKGRGVSGEVAARFGLGYAPAERDNLRKIFPDYTAKELQETGLVIARESDEKNDIVSSFYDRFRDRIMFPIRNIKGQIIGFGARIISKGEPKYLNSPETPLFQKGNELYGLFEAHQAIRDTGYVLVVEGYMDVVALAQLGFPQTVATLGTACTTVQIQKLMRQTDLIVFAFDGDKAGQTAARRALESSLSYITDNKSVRFLFLPENHDPDSFIRKYGAEVFKKEVENAIPFSEFLFQVITKEKDLNTLEGRAKAQSIAKPLLQAIKPSALRLQIVRKLSEMTQTSSDELEVFLGLSHKVNRKKTVQRRQEKPQITSLNRQILRILLGYPELVFELNEEERDAIERFSPNEKQTLSDLVNTVYAVGENINFAKLTEYLRISGRDYDDLIAEVVKADDFGGDNFNVLSARKQLKDALLKIRIRLITEELNNLIETKKVFENPQYFRDLQKEQHSLQQKIENKNNSLNE